MQEIKIQVIRKIRNKYKAGLFFDFTPYMTELLGTTINKIIKDAKKATETYNKLDEQDVTDLLNNFSKDTAESIKKNILDINLELKQLVDKIVKENGSADNLQDILLKEINNKFNTQLTKGRINVIATTETTKMYGKTAKETIVKSGKLPVWRHTGRGKTDRATHRAASGQKMSEKRKAFFVGGEWIEHPASGSPKNAVNCHCILVAE